MEKLIDILKKNSKVVGIGAAAALALGAIYYLTKKEQGVEQTTRGNDEEKGIDQSEYRKKAQEIAKKIVVRTVGDTQNYDMNTISQVMELSLELAEEEYVQITLDNRKQRRAMMETDINGYEKLVLQYNEDVENVIKKAQTAILELLNISYDNFEESVIVFMEKGHYQEIYMFQAAIRQKIKEKIKYTKNLSVDNLKDIISFQHEILKQQPELLKNLLQKLSGSPETAQLIPIILGTLINDYIYKEYQVEEEDQMQVMTKPEMINDPEIIILIQQVEQAMFSIIATFNPNMEGMY